MFQLTDLAAQAARYHSDLPARILDYLHARGIPDPIVNRHLLGWTGWRISIPVFNREGQFAFFKFARDPGEEHPSPKMLASRGSTLELYGWEVVLGKPASVIICEGEFDRLVLEAQGFEAVTSTGGAGAFRPEWADDFKYIPEVYICFDRDEAGERGALRVARLIPHAKLVALPPDVGEGGDVTDFFVRLGFGRDDFLKLLEEAVPPPAPIYEEPKPPAPSSPDRERIERVKKAVPIEGLIGRSVALRPSGGMLVGLCPFHEDHVPSLTVYPRTGTFHCYGCLKHGDVIDFVRYREDLSFKEAMDQLETMTTEHGGQPE
jgi:DNA primase